MNDLRRISCGTRVLGAIAVAVASVGIVRPADGAAGDTNLVFRRTTVEEGLPAATVRSILQDRQGFLWFGTQGGLVRYDGQELRIHVPVPGDPTSVAGRVIDELFEDSHGGIWVGTYLHGVCRYDPSTERFERVSGHGAPAGRVSAIAESSDGRMWFGTGDGALISHDPAEGGFSAFRPFGDERETIGAILVDSGGRVWIGNQTGRLKVLDRRGRELALRVRAVSAAEGGPLREVRDLHEFDSRIWVAGDGGVLVIDPSSMELLHFPPSPMNSGASSNFVICLARDARGRIWAGSAAGILRFDQLGGRFDIIRHDPGSDNTIGPGPVMDLTIDRSGQLWSGHWQGGLTNFDPGGGIFRVSRHLPGRTGSLHMDATMAVHRDARGRLWVGTGTQAPGSEIGGLNLETSGGFRHFAIPDPSVWVVLSLADAPVGRLKVGTNSGLWDFDPESGSFKRSPDPALRAVDDVPIRAMLHSRSGEFWMGTNGAGLLRRDPQGVFQHYRHVASDSSSLGSDVVTSVYEDNTGRIWIGTDESGLSLYQPRTDDFVRYCDPASNLATVLDLEEDAQGRLWIATLAGLIQFDRHQGVRRVVDRSTGLPNDLVGTIVKDGRGRFWLSTGHGVALFDPASGDLQNFDRLDGLPTNETCFQGWIDDKGEAFLASTRGLVRFRPDDYTPDVTSPPVVLTSLLVNNEPAIAGEHSPLTKSISQAESLELEHDQGSLVLSFASLEFGRPERHRYRYRLRGHDDSWIDAGHEGRAIYTGIRPGSYVFEAQGTNGHGVWSENVATLPIVVHHPWWSSPAASFAYVAMALGLIALGYSLLLRREREQMLIRQRLAEVEKLEEVDRMKSRFFANISHEIRTPLTLIEGLLHRHEERPQETTRESFDVMFRNTRRLRKLIDQLLDLARLDADRFHLRWRRTDVVREMRVISASFESLAESRGIRYAADLPLERAEGWIDPDVLETIVSNLLSNAVKYVDHEGLIGLDLTLGDEEEMERSVQDRLGLRGPARYRKLSITVSNTGRHIRPEDREQIFERFTQSADDDTRDVGGSGVGLALVRELALLVGGDVEVDSSPATGTAFTIHFALVTSSETFDGEPDVNEISEPEASARLVRRRRRMFADVEPATASGSQREDGSTELHPEDRTILLIVEDHPDLRRFLAEGWGPEFDVRTAVDGQAGLELAAHTVPDIIISDVMMPRLDGFGLLEAVRKDPATSHVPLILLTARADVEARRQGLSAGADDYIAKPVAHADLMLRVENLLAQRERLRAYHVAALRGQPVPDPLTVDKPGPDPALVGQNDRFLNRAMTVIDENLADEDFGVEEFAQKVGLSRPQLHRKLKALTGKPTSAVLRQRRLWRAATLIASDYGSVADVAYAVGFKSLSHFSRNFREEFGVVPSQYGKASETEGTP